MPNTINDRRTDPTIAAIRANWQIIVALVLGLGFAFTIRGDVSGLKADMTVVQGSLSTEAFTEFTRWKVNVERDIQALQKGCK